jgi:hypothetical protein
MATTQRDQRIITVEVSRAELITLLADRAKQAGLIDFDPDNIQVVEVDPAQGTYNILFEVG